MAGNRFNISRDVLAKFLPDNDTIRRFENLFQAVGELDPIDLSLIFSLLEELSVSVSTASSGSVSVNDALSVVQRLLDHVVSAPAYDPSRISELESVLREITPTATRPAFEMPRSFPVDYIDFDRTPPHTDKVARIAWNADDDTLNLHHSNNVTQQIGLETYARITNNSGATLPNGSAVGFDPATNTFELFIADGSLHALNIVGICTEDILNGELGRITNWGRVRDIDTTGAPVGEVWALGDALYVSTTVAGGLTNVKPTAPNISLPIAQVRVLNAVTGEIFVRPTIEQQLFYGQFVKTSDQVPSAINTANAITWPAALIANGVSIGAPTSRVVVANAGLYKFAVSFQLTSSSAAVKNVWFWFRKNGTDIADTSLIVSVDSATAIRVPSRDLLISLAAGDYVELMWASDSTAVTLDAIAATAFAPAAPAAILTVNQEQQ